jgi:Sulfotransferase family
VTVQGQRFFFAHVQKAAGTSLIFRLRRQFGRPAIYPMEPDKGNVAGVISVDHLLDRWRAHSHEIRVVTGHFPLCTTELLDTNFTTLTVLRDPIERTLSYLRHHREFSTEDRDRPLESVYDDPLRFHGLVHNHMVKMFSLTRSEMTDGVMTHVEFTTERLERAKENLAAVDALGLQEHFDEFCQELTVRFGWDLGEPTHVNRTAPVEVPDGLRSRIVEDNAMDLELYAFARQLYQERRAARSPGSPTGM